MASEAPPMPPSRQALARRFVDNAHVRFSAHTAAVVGLLLLVTQVWFPAPLPVLVVGLVFGALTALSAIGVVLVYRAARVVNFSQGETGAVSGIVTLQLIGAGIPFFAAVVLGLCCGIAVGAVVEVAIVRRFSQAPRLILTVATIGVAQLLAGAQLGLPMAFGNTVAPQDFATPLHASLTWGPVVFRGDHLLAFGTVAATAVALAAFLRRTRYGLAIRAGSESLERAAQLGVPIRRLSIIVWSAAAGMSALAVILRAPLVGLPVGEVLGPSLLVRSLAAAVIGGMHDLRLTFAAALGLGVLEQAVYWHTGRSSVADATMFVALAVAVLARAATFTRARTDTASSWDLLAPIRPIPRELVRLPEVAAARLLLPVGGIGLLLLLPGVLTVSQVNLAAGGLILAIVGVSLVVLTGWSGQISLGQMALFGAGAVTAAATASRGWHALAVLAFAGVCGVVLAMGLGFAALRLPPAYLPVMTLAFALAASSFLLTSEFLGTLHSAARVARPVIFGHDLEDATSFYRFVLLILVLTVASAAAMRRSRVGRAWLATRDNDRAAASFGLRAASVRLWAFAVSGGFAALAGALFTFSQHGLSPSAWLPEESIRVFTMVVFGGLGSLVGVLAGAVYITAVQYLAPAGALQFLASGTGLLVVLMFLRGGLAGLMFTWRDGLLRAIARRRGISVAVFADDDAADAPAPMRVGA